MASLQASSLMFFSSSSCCCSSRRVNVNAAISLPKLPKIRFSTPKTIISSRDLGLTNPILIEKIVPSTMIQEHGNEEEGAQQNIRKLTAQLYAILEAVCDRVEMHRNLAEQRDNWNTLLLNSINMITLTAATMAGVGGGASLLALKLSAALLFSAATGMMVVVNKIQPSQLAEEQRNAVRLFKQLQREIETVLAIRIPCEEDVEEAMEKVLALDRAYPLPLLGNKMIEKFPKTFEPAVWWPSKRFQRANVGREMTKQNNGWSDQEVEMEMREVVQVLKTKDREDYERLGNLILKTNKFLAISGPLLTGIAAIGSCAGSPSWAAAAGALATVVNTFEHGGQLGMVLEMYRNCAGFFMLLEESIESTVDESEVEKRENGEMFEMKVALKLGRSLSELRDLARKSSYSHIEGTQVGEFASKLF
ncbi:hypothetical protein ACOSP7_012869 [Xanthoceras sorbifolium]|uniref:F-box protein n=1 Tax=Xanthoceras sorbifolium TaxID=99658 RepID=A0ABQ8HYL0_9ROSI|nr:hypothetical protein JRO89_XS06G0165800 [Xanthoceras sorbifolium]